MSKKFFPLILLFFGSTVMSQSKINGTIKDNKGKPIPAISVTLKDTYDGSVSDSSGNFSFTTSETGAHMIEVTGVGYHDYSAPVELKNVPIKLDVVLKER